MKKVLIVEPILGPLGGGIVVTVWMLEALKQKYQVSILTWKPLDIEILNHYYGRRDSDFKVYSVSLFLRFLINSIPSVANFQRFCLLMRLCQKMQFDYDVVITARDSADLGDKGIQYINYPYKEADTAKPDLGIFESDISRQKLRELVVRHKYGIHGMIDEHFGIAVAEMVKGGCITFVPNSGGQVEIVGKENRLLYSTVE